MKYLTPELLARFQADDEGAALKAHDEWDEAGERYRAEWKSLREKFPRQAVSLRERFYLHDARVLLAAARSRFFTVVLQLDADNGGLQIEYKLAAPVILTPHPEIAEDCPLEWLYDEFDVLEKDSVTVFAHSILFTDGSELRLVFHNLQWKHYPRAMFVGSGMTPGGIASVALTGLVGA
jgi:hypothetical protein